VFAEQAFPYPENAKLRFQLAVDGASIALSIDGKQFDSRAGCGVLSGARDTSSKRERYRAGFEVRAI